MEQLSKHSKFISSKFRDTVTWLILRSDLKGSDLTEGDTTARATNSDPEWSDSSHSTSSYGRRELILPSIERLKIQMFCLPVKNYLKYIKFTKLDRT